MRVNILNTRREQVNVPDGRGAWCLPSVNVQGAQRSGSRAHVPSRVRLWYLERGRRWAYRRYVVSGALETFSHV